MGRHEHVGRRPERAEEGRGRARAVATSRRVPRCRARIDVRFIILEMSKSNEWCSAKARFERRARCARQEASPHCRSRRTSRCRPRPFGNSGAFAPDSISHSANSFTGLSSRTIAKSGIAAAAPSGLRDGAQRRHNPRWTRGGRAPDARSRQSPASCVWPGSRHAQCVQARESSSAQDTQRSSAATTARSAAARLTTFDSAAAMISASSNASPGRAQRGWQNNACARERSRGDRRVDGE